MDPVLFPLFLQAFGSIAGRLLKKAAEKHVQDFFGAELKRLAALGRKHPLVTAMENAYAACFEMLLRNLQGVGFDLDDFKPYEKAVRSFLDDATVAEELLKPVIDVHDRLSPDADVLRDAWSRLECWDLPPGFAWENVVAGYRLQVTKEKIADAKLRDELTAANLLAVREDMRKLAGVQPEADVVRYAQRMRQKYRVLDLSALQNPTVDEPGRILLRDAFVPQKAREDPPADEIPRDLLRKLVEDGEWSEDEIQEHEHLARQVERVRDVFVRRPPRPVLDVVAEPRNQRLVVLGGPGSGKSTLTRYLLLSVLDLRGRTDAPPWLEAFRGHLPLLLELREFIAERDEKRCEGFLDFWHSLGKTDGYFLDAGWLDDTLKTKPSLVLIDGLDEIFDPRDRDRAAQMIVGFAATYPRARLIVTSRPIGYQKKALDDADFRHFALEDLDEAQVESFVRGWFGLVFLRRPREAEQRIERVLTATKASRPIRLLAGNPMLLTIMTLIAQLRELPRERWRFYDYAAEVLCHHWDVNRHLEDAGLEADYVGLEDKKELLRRIAFQMQAAEGGLVGNFIRAQALTEVVESYLAERYRHPPAEAKRVASALIRQLRERNYVLCLRGPGIYGFVHRTFLEYFCAYELVERLEKTTEFAIDTLRTEYFAEHWRDAAWAEPLRLVCGMIGEDYAATIIEFLISIEINWPKSTGHLPPHFYFAVQCLSEVQNRHRLGDVNKRFQNLLRQRARKNHPVTTREAALRALATGWPGDESIRDFLLKQAEKGEHADVQSTALQLLVSSWPRDKLILELLRKRARKAEHFTVRTAALELLASGWSEDNSTVRLLQQRAEEDRSVFVRRRALQLLTSGWSEDESIRNLLRRILKTDEHEFVRIMALQTLPSTWLEDESTRDLLRECAEKDQHASVRKTALQMLTAGCRQEVAIALSQYDPLEPVSSEHVQQLAKKLKIEEDVLRRFLAAAEEELGWNPIVGLKASKGLDSGDTRPTT